MARSKNIMMPKKKKKTPVWIRSCEDIGSFDSPLPFPLPSESYLQRRIQPQTLERGH